MYLYVDTDLCVEACGYECILYILCECMDAYAYVYVSAHGYVDIWMDIWMDGCMDIWMDTWMDTWTDIWMDGDHLTHNT